MRLRVLGSSDAFNGAGRCHASYLLESEGLAPVVVDFGATGLLALRLQGLPAKDIGAVIVTHLHGDHFGGLPFLLLDGMYNEVRSRPLELVGAVGLEARVQALFQAFYSDVADRPRHFETVYRELAPGADVMVAGLRVETFAADHMDPPDQPLCLRVTTPNGKVVAFSGDTEPCEGLYAAAKGADLLVAECTGLRPPCGRHCSWVDWQTMFAAVLRAGPRRILMSHLGTDVRAARERLSLECPPEVTLTFADDGLVVDV
ncbi:MAG: MBL fold metallo-hydrolase [Myxococcota bacterium]